MSRPDGSRKQTGAWYTPKALVDEVVANVITPHFVGGIAARRPTVRVIDPACGDGRFLVAAQRRITELGGTAELVGVDVDECAITTAREQLQGADLVVDDSLERVWGGSEFDLVIGNPPFLSQLATPTTRGGSGERGGGPYADAAVEFLALAAELVDPAGGRVAFVLPQSLLSSRDAVDVRRSITERSRFVWTWWTGEQVFDAQVLVCALAFEFGATPDDRAGERADNWSWVVTGRTGVPRLPGSGPMSVSGSGPVRVSMSTAGTLGDRARLNANFRDEYYGMVQAVGDHGRGPQLVTSGLIDPGRLCWGERPVTFARRRFDHPRIDLGLLDARMQRWAADRLVPKVLVANQTRIIEAVCDPDGILLPGVPVVAVYPAGRHNRHTGAAVDPLVWEIAAVLTSPVASAWAWHRSGGTGLSANTIRLGPAMLSDLPWPAGDLTAAVTALRSGDVRRCGRAVTAAFGIDDADGLFRRWWESALDRIDARAERADCAIREIPPSSTTRRDQPVR